MNQRVEQLRTEAWRYANNYQGDIVMPQLQRFEQKFAELIVKECIDAIENESMNSGDEWEAGINMAIEAVRQRFDLE